MDVNAVPTYAADLFLDIVGEVDRARERVRRRMQKVETIAACLQSTMPKIEIRFTQTTIDAIWRPDPEIELIIFRLKQESPAGKKDLHWSYNSIDASGKLTNRGMISCISSVQEIVVFVLKYSLAWYYVRYGLDGSVTDAERDAIYWNLPHSMRKGD